MIAHESLELGLSGDDFFIAYVVNRQGQFVGGMPFFPETVGDGTLRKRILPLAARAREGTAGVLLLPLEGDNDARVGWLRTLK